MKAPAHFSEKTRKLWKDIHQEYELEPEADELLRVALENLDLADKARELLRAEGLVVDGKRHPASDAVKLHDGMFLRALRQLGLDVVAPGPIGRPAGR
jgi:anthranilate phosphoribosyltransferase